MQLRFSAIDEGQLGTQWQTHAVALWPSYQRWWQRDGDQARPTYLACRKALRQHMPEMEATWSRAVELLGGGDAQARFLSMWGPPPYITGCSQAVWLGTEPAQARLLRNYDFAPALFEGVWLATQWTGQRVLAMSDCLWGALDGINESGLAASLSFGGRKASGQGFGVPLVVRYLLEVAQDVPEAVVLLKRLPHHMSYTVSLLDRAGRWATVFLAPDRPVELVDRRSCSNIQHRVEWPQHDQATRASLRAEKLEAALAEVSDPRELVSRMMQVPLWQGAFSQGYGTLYTAVYSPDDRQMCLHWPNQESWCQSTSSFESEVRFVEMAEAPPLIPVRGSQDRWMLASPTSF